jgi:hypothetical protein
MECTGVPHDRGSEMSIFYSRVLHLQRFGLNASSPVGQSIYSQSCSLDDLADKESLFTSRAEPSVEQENPTLNKRKRPASTSRARNRIAMW